MKLFRWLLTLVVLGGLYGGAYLQGQQPPTLMYGLDVSTKLTHPISVDSQGNLGLAGTFSGAVAGGLTNNGAAPSTNNLGVLSVLANAAAPSWTEGRLVTLSTDLAGALRVSGGGGGLQYTLGATTSGESGNVILGAVTTAAPTYTTAQSNAISLTTAGSVRVDVMNTTGTPFPAASALADAQANPTTPLIGAAMMAFNGATWDRLQPAVDYAQNSVTSGQNGGLMQGAATLAAPSYTTARTSPLSMDLAGNLRVVGPKPCDAIAHTTIPISVAADTAVITASASNRNYLCGGALIAGVAEIVNIWEGTGSACGTSSAAVAGSTTEANGMSLSANGGFVIASPIRGLSTNVDTCLRLSGTNRVAGWLDYVQAP